MIKITDGLFMSDSRLNSGSFGSIYEGKFEDKSGRTVPCVIKVPTNQSDEESLSNFKKECNLQEQLIHPNIIKTYKSGSFLFRGVQTPYIAMEILGQDLWKYMMSRKDRSRSFSEKEARILFFDICQGVKYLHETAGLIHRDLKMNNILISESCNLKIIDFGFCKQITKNTMASFVGTPITMAPEILQIDRELEASTPKLDIWSLGCILNYLVTANHLINFKTLTSKDAICQSAQNQFKRGLKFSASLSPDLRDLLGKMCHLDPNQRIDINEVLKHKWFTELEEGLQSSTRQSVLNSNNMDHVTNNSDSMKLNLILKAIMDELSTSISTATSTHIREILEFKPIDSQQTSIMNLNSLFVLRKLFLLKSLKQMELIINEDEEKFQMNLFDFIDEDLKRHCLDFQNKNPREYFNEKLLSKSVKQVFEDILRLCKEINEDDSINSKEKSQVFNALQYMKNEKGRLLIRIDFDTDKFDTDPSLSSIKPINKKSIKVKISNFIRKGNVIASAEFGKKKSICKVNSFIKIEAEFTRVQNDRIN